MLQKWKRPTPAIAGTDRQWPESGVARVCMSCRSTTEVLCLMTSCMHGLQINQRDLMLDRAEDLGGEVSLPDHRGRCGGGARRRARHAEHNNSEGDHNNKRVN